MRTAAECTAKAVDLEQRALQGPEEMRAEWDELAGLWRRLAIRAEADDSPQMPAS